MNIDSCIIRQQPEKLQRPLGIGIVGAGNITNMHLRGYAWAGLPVVAIMDLDSSKAEARAKEHGIPHVAGSLEELIARPEVEIVDVTFPGNARLEAVRAIAEAGKPLLVQKPLADDLETAREIVRTCREAGVALAVNQNARFNPQYRTARRLVEEGVLGEVYHALHHLSSNHDGMPHHAPWLYTPERYQILQFGVHHLDQICTWFGRMPRAVTATNTRKPGQQFKGDMLATICLDFGDTAGATLLELNALHAKRPYEATFEINGTRGALIGSFDGDLRLYHEDLGKDPKLIRPEGNWFPNAFGMVMLDFQQALRDGREPEVSGEANLPLLALIEDCYRSIQERRTITENERTPA
ncbi:MAG: Gfo/Idh/MocA family protein [Opitutales bacterium]